jgi:hypothetical protein
VTDEDFERRVDAMMSRLTAPPAAARWRRAAAGGGLRRPFQLPGLRALPALAAAAVVAVAVLSTGPRHATSPPPAAQATPSGPALVIGAYNGTNAGTVTAGFLETNAQIGPLRVRRVYASDLPVDVEQTDAAGDHAAGITTFLSVKAAPAEVTAGLHDAQITALARSMYDGDYLTIYHQPEPAMTGAEYVAMSRHFYTVAKAARPGLYVGNVYMAYQWRPISTTTVDEDAWWVGSAYTDFLGVDSHWQSWRGPIPQSLGEDPWQLRWHDWASAKGKPLLVVENGIDVAYSDAQRAAYFAGSEQWLRGHGYRMWMIFNGGANTCCGITGPGYDFPQTQAVWRAIAARGRSDTSLR